ncbi:hypothetical protein ACF9IK_27485 [Kitasatospora hibisci]|uniref:hypothetical protein n=1 Tax=Kitasatospora hibisci TaxID=3369522 RepID=UPI00375511D6
MTSDRVAKAEKALREAMDRLLAGDVPDGLKCDVKSLALLSGVPRPTLYRTYPHVKEEFEQRLARTRETTGEPDPREARIERLKAEQIRLKTQNSSLRQQVAEHAEFKTAALSQIAALYDALQQHRADASTVPLLRPVR